MKKFIGFVTTIACILICFSNAVSAEQENIYTFNTVSNNKTPNSNNSVPDATLYGETSLTSGISGNSVYFNGINSYIELPEENDMQSLSTISLSMWIKPKIDNSVGEMPVLHCGEVAKLTVDNETGMIKLKLLTSSVSEIKSSYIVESDKWYNVVVTYDGSTLHLYINGKLDSSISAWGNIALPDASIHIGTDGTSYYKGNVDEVAFYNHVLSESVIAENYRSYVDAITDWNYVSYPLKSIYPHGISSANVSLFKNSKIHKPINTGFEERNETNAIDIDNKNNQLKVVEDKYTGKFALSVNMSGSDILPIKETDYFTTTDMLTASNFASQDDSKISIDTNDKRVTVSGVKSAYEIVTLLVKQGNTISYVDQSTTDAFGFFRFSFPLTEYGNYALCVGGSNSNAYWTSFVLSKEGHSLPSSNESEPIQVKCNFYNVMVKPMYQSETISFYIKTKVNDEDGNQTEEYALIKSDRNGDGIFKVGEDLSRGKWQKIELNLSDIDDALQNGTASGLYMSANIGSEWIFDDIDSGYKKINQSDMDLSKFAKNNIVYSDNTLQFANSGDDKNKYFNTNETVVMGGMDVSEKLSEISIKTDKMYVGTENPEPEAEPTILFSEPLSSPAWTVNDTDYDTSEYSVSKKTDKIYERDEIPELPSWIQTSIKINKEKEKRFRLKFGVADIYPNTNLIVTDIYGKSTTYLPSSNLQYTEWYSDDIVITTASGGDINSCFKIYSIEYESIDLGEKDIVMKNSGTAIVDLGELTTNDRTKLVCSVNGYKSTGSGTLNLELLENGEVYYWSVIKATLDLNAKDLEHIIPKIRQNTQIRIRNYFRENSSNSAYELRLVDFKIVSLAESDWNKEKENLYNITAKEFFYNTVPVETTFYGSSNTAFDTRWIDEVGDESNLYAASHQNTGGILNLKSYNRKLSLNNSKAILRIVNLGSGTACFQADNGQNTTYLQYGECDYICYGGNIILPPNSHVVVVSVSYLTDGKNSNHLNYIPVDGLSTAYDVTSDGSKVFYANINDKNTLYSYDFDSKTYTKIYNSGVKEITVNDDGKQVALRKADNKYILLETDTLKETELPMTTNSKFCFSPQNELFILSEDIYYDNTIYYVYRYNNGELFSMLEGEKIPYVIDMEKQFVTFDRTGNYMHIMSTSLIFKKTNGVWSKISLTVSAVSGYLSSDATTIYSNCQSININTNTTKKLPLYSIVGKTQDDILLMKGDGYYYLYNPITEDISKIFDRAVNSFTDEAFYSEQNIFMALATPNSFVRHQYTDKAPELKYALSFDGKDNWYTYTGGRWKLLSKNEIPTIEEMKASGMTEDEVNTIPTTAYDKLYHDGTDVLTVDMAIYMNSPANNQTPVVKQITVNTRDNNELNGIYGINLEKYDKSDYRTVSSLFPIETFAGDTECYYLLYIGNDWLYTYKNNKLVKVLESADELLSDIGSSWISFKQYGMTAKEVRSIPSDVINSLFVNENYANTEFGIIYVVKTKDDDTSGYTVNFRLKSESSFIAEDDVVIEIVMNGGDVRIIDSNEFSKKDIENLLGWIEARQSGTGDIFYRIKNDKVQYFINYYMINAINVYNGTEYRESHSQENAAQ